jgi:flagella basal body P-ring formation protein FlgA
MSRVRGSVHAMRSAVVMLAVALSCASARSEAQQLPVPKIVIYPGEVISDQSLADRAYNAAWSAKMPVYKARSELVGKVARRTLVAGQPIPLNATRVPDAITQGKSYRMEFREAGLVISGTAVAVTSGAVGDLVTLRNPDSGVMVRGIAGADGIVRVTAQ